MEEKDFEKKSKKKAGLIVTVVILVLMALIAVGGFVYLKTFNNKPQKIFEKAISKVFDMVELNSEKEGKLDIEVSASLNSQQQDMMMANAYLQMAKLNLTTEFNMDKKVLNQEISVSAFDEPVISIEGLIQDNNMYFLLNNIYSKYIQVPSEEMEGIEIDEIFNTENIEVSEKIVKELKQILLDEVNSKKLTQENVKVDGDKLTKTTVKFTAKEIEQIITELIDELYKISPINEIKNIVEELEQIEIDDEDIENDNYLEIAIYTKRLTGKIVKTEVSMINVTDDEAIVVTIAEKEYEKVEITFAINEDSIDISKAVTMFTLTIKEEGDNKDTVTLKANIDETSSVTITVKYSIDYNTKVEQKNVRNSINANDLTDEDMNEIETNIENNEFLYNIIQSYESSLIEDVESAAEKYKSATKEEYNSTLENNESMADYFIVNDSVNNYSETTINNI